MTHAHSDFSAFSDTGMLYEKCSVHIGQQINLWSKLAGAMAMPCGMANCLIAFCLPGGDALAESERLAQQGRRRSRERPV
jgi:hypothetical protein